ncbi:gem-associated protein 8 isoform X2 [Brachyistius frenatus]|uniref:gem-associated protein 8 isoform X2 n=1 Tax=Brachyistius frenatus TaxID=100188 RepID=UPI0037E8B445
MDEVGMVMSWFSSSVYSNYWQHYQQSMAWHQRHRRAYRKAWGADVSDQGQGYCRLSRSNSPKRRRSSSSSSLHQRCPSSFQHRRPSSFQHRRPSSLHQRRPSSFQQQRYADWRAVESDDEDDDDDDDKESSSDSDIECDVSNMEISKELRQYFAQTERHREELKKQQQMETEQQEGYVQADQPLHAVSWQSSAAPPCERPDETRTAEMKKLYGKDAAKIQAMETAMQLTFNRNCDLKQPNYWPVIPLRL